MPIPSSAAWKVVLALTLVGAIALSAFASAPRRAVPRSELRRLVASAIGLYLLGGLASISHHSALAAVIYTAGIVIGALAAWLARGADSEDPPDGDDPGGEPPPPKPGGLPGFDWDEFERAFRAYAERGRDPVG